MSDKPDYFREDFTGEVMSGMEIVDRATGFPTPDEPAATPPRPRGRWRDSRPPVTPRLPRPKRPDPMKPLRRPALALPAMVLLAIVAAFFAWVSAGPFWLSVGHDVAGTVTIVHCDETAFAAHCRGDFRSHDGGANRPGVRVTGDAKLSEPGETVAAQAVSSDSRMVYVGSETGLLLRWLLGLAGALACGVAIAVVTGAWRWVGRERRLTVTACLAGPVFLWLGALLLTW